MNRFFTKDDIWITTTWKKMFNIVLHYGNRIKTAIRYPYMSTWMSKIKEWPHHLCTRMWAIGACFCCWAHVRGYILHLPWEILGSFLEVRHKATPWPAHSVPGHLPISIWRFLALSWKKIHQAWCIETIISQSDCSFVM